MERDEIVYQSAKGVASFQWKTERDQPPELCNMYLITYSDGNTLWTNSMYVIKDRLSASDKVGIGQLSLFD